MNRVKNVLLAGVTVCAFFSIAGEVPKSYWWHFNGGIGQEAPTAIADDSESYELSRYQCAKSGETYAQQMAGRDCKGTVAVYGAAQKSVGRGSVEMYRANTSGGYRASAAYRLDNADTHLLFPTNNQGEIRPFTIEMVFKAYPQDEKCSAANMRFLQLGRSETDTGSQIFTLNTVSGGQLYLQCNSVVNGNGNLCNFIVSPSPSAFRDGQWHHVALVYSLDESSQPHQGRVQVYLDHTLAASKDLSDTKYGGETVFRYERHDKTSPYGLLAGTTGSFSVGDVAGQSGALDVDEVRVSQAALSKEEFFDLRNGVRPETDDLVYWSFATEEASGTALSRVGEANGRTAYALEAAVSDQSTVTADYLPQVSDCVPVRALWNPVSGKVINPDNRTSVRFLNNGHLNERGEFVNGTGGGYLSTANVDHFAESYTVEMFVNPAYATTEKYTAIAQQQMSDFCYVLVDASRAINANLKLRFPSDPSTVNRHLASSGALVSNAWRHVAYTVDATSVPGKMTIALYVDYLKIAENVCDSPFDLTTKESYSFGWASGQGQAFNGHLDEIRMSRGVLPAEAFMRSFEPREDGTSVWLVDGLSGKEHYAGDEVAYLNGTLTDATVSTELPFANMVFKTRGKPKVRPTNSVRFGGLGGLAVPCAVIAGADDFTVEATVCGTGDVAAKQSAQGETWFFGIGGDGKPYLGVGSEVEVADGAVESSAWHHLALVCDRTNTHLAKLFVDGIEVVSVDISGLVMDDGDLVFGPCFTGNMIGVRYTASAVAQADFMVPSKDMGLILLLK